MNTIDMPTNANTISPISHICAASSMSCVSRKAEGHCLLYVSHKVIQHSAFLGLSLNLLLYGIRLVHLTLDEGEQIVAPVADLF